jgi:hypothetical protein
LLIVIDWLLVPDVHPATIRNLKDIPIIVKSVPVLPKKFNNGLNVVNQRLTEYWDFANFYFWLQNLANF